MKYQTRLKVTVGLLFTIISAAFASFGHQTGTDIELSFQKKEYRIEGIVPMGFSGYVTLRRHENGLWNAAFVGEGWGNSA